MKNLGKFSFYTPEEAAASGARHIHNEQGTDWYTISWDKERTGKNNYAGTDDSGQVIVITEDGAMFFPANMTAWEIPKEDTPTDFLTVGYNAKIIDGVWSVDYASIAEKKRQSLLSEANTTISLWRTKLLAGKTLTDDQKTKLDAWLDYMDKLDALDFTSIEDETGYKAIAWPDKPE